MSPDLVPSSIAGKLICSAVSEYAPLDRKFVEARLNKYFFPVHRVVEQSLSEAKSKSGLSHVDLIGLHQIAESISGPDIVISSQSLDPKGDLDALVRLAKDMFDSDGFRTEINPIDYGKWFIEHYHCPAKGVHTIEIDIKRSLLRDPVVVNECNFNRFQSTAMTLIFTMNGYMKAHHDSKK